MFGELTKAIDESVDRGELSNEVVGGGEYMTLNANELNEFRNYLF